MKINLEKGKVKCYERKTLEHSAELGASCPIMQKHRGHCAESDICSISEKYLNCNKKGKHRNTWPSCASCLIMQKTPQPLRRVGHLESGRMSAVYQRNVWVVTKKEALEHSPELGARCPIIQNAASITRSWTSGVRLDVRGMLEKYSSRNMSQYNIVWDAVLRWLTCLLYYALFGLDSAWLELWTEVVGNWAVSVRWIWVQNVLIH